MNVNKKVIFNIIINCQLSVVIIQYSTFLPFTIFIPF